jgi:hypothetical protein
VYGNIFCDTPTEVKKLDRGKWRQEAHGHGSRKREKRGGDKLLRKKEGRVNVMRKYTVKQQAHIAGQKNRPANLYA